jgi:ribosomal protein S18 acetylase RimI-like enzyme
MKIVEIEKAEIHKIKNLWEELNSCHGEKSSHFKSHFESFVFEKRIERLLAKEHLVIYAAESNSELVGYSIATVDGNLGEIDSIFVKKAHRGNNLGHRLTEKALSWLSQFDCDAINVHVAEGNESALPFYEKHGFRERYRVLQLKKAITL